jgi:hypothetical protein
MHHRSRGEAVARIRDDAFLKEGAQLLRPYDVVENDDFTVYP